MVVVVCGWLDGSTDRLIDHIDIEAKEPILSETFSLTKTVFHFGFSQLHGRFVEANLHETIQMVKHQSTPSRTQTAPLRAQKNTKVMMINWSII